MLKIGFPFIIYSYNEQNKLQPEVLGRYGEISLKYHLLIIEVRTAQGRSQEFGFHNLRAKRRDLRAAGVRGLGGLTPLDVFCKIGGPRAILAIENTSHSENFGELRSSGVVLAI